MTPDIKFRVKSHKYIGLEAGVHYSGYAAGKEQWGAKPKCYK